MSPVLFPATLEELSAAVKSHPRVAVHGQGTKPNLISGKNFEGTILSTLRLSRIVDYEPTEFTFTAAAGTPVQLITEALAEKGQYLPFDPPMVRQGATLGGMVAAGLNGPGRLRFGGIRDFILGVKFVDGNGQILRMGGKVVKNAAGFDLPKFFVGSLGCFGILGEITFKVFPQPPDVRTLLFHPGSPERTLQLMAAIAAGRWEVEAIEAPADLSSLYIRLRGTTAALEILAAELCGKWSGKILLHAEAEKIWEEINSFSWAHPTGLLAKIPLTPRRCTEFSRLVQDQPEARGRIGIAGNVGYLSLPPGREISSLSPTLAAGGFSALAWRGDCHARLGVNQDFAVYSAVKVALDPVGRFPSLR